MQEQSDGLLPSKCEEHITCKQNMNAHFHPTDVGHELPHYFLIRLFHQVYVPALVKP
jgi:hypothetical protein